MEEILNMIEDKNIEFAGGSIVGMVLSTVNSLIIYISNLTLGKKKYEEVQDDVLNIIEEANILKKESLKIMNDDRIILKKLLESYKISKSNREIYIDTCKETTEFCVKVLEHAYSILKLSDRISKVGNKMLSSDFKICKYYSFASIQSAIANVEINVKAIDDEIYKEKIKEKCNSILEESRRYM